MNPGSFSGTSGEDVNEFITRYERACRVNEWGTDELKARFISMFLTGAAALWLDNIEATDHAILKKYPDLKTKLLSAFEPRIPTDRAEFKLRTRTQLPGETLENYYQDVMKLCRQVNADMADADKARHLLHGLSRTLIKDVMLLQNETPDQVLQNARKAEIAMSYSTTQDTVHSELLKKANDQISDLSKKLAELTTEVKTSKTITVS